MLFFSDIEVLNKELDSVSLTHSKLVDIISRLRNLIQIQFGLNHGLTKILNSISTEPKGTYFPEMIEKEKEKALIQCKKELKELIQSANIEFKRIIIDKPFEEIILNQESQFLEFKSTLVWDVNNSKPDKKIMGEIIMKSISAFSNSEGGILLIGVSDDKKILGLNSDYKTFNNGKGNRDDFELHLTTLIINNFSKTFAKDNISIEFPQAKSKEICLIRIKKGNAPYTIKISDKSGQQKEKFFIRVNNSSRDIDNILELVRYIKTRFDEWN